MLVVLPLKYQQRALVQIAEIYLPPFLLHLRVFSTEQPANVRKEKAPVRIVGIGVGLRILMMNPMISGPLDNVILQRGSLKDNENETEGERRFERAMRPQTMRSGRYPDATHQV